MRITTDHAFHIGSQHLRSGLPCQDYATSGEVTDGSYAIISDGCSTGGKTDVGARIVAHTTASFLWKQGVTGTYDFDCECYRHDARVAFALGLEQRDLLATCAYIKAIPALPGVQVRLMGDGVVAHRNINGRIWMERLDWAGNMPAYRAYHADTFHAFRCAQRENFFPATKRTYHSRDANGHASDWSSEADLPVSLAGVECFWNSEDVANLNAVAVFSDGVTQVDGMDWRDVVAELMAFKSTEGDFVKRRMNRFLKDCLRHGKGPFDDISMAAIHIDHEVTR